MVREKDRGRKSRFRRHATPLLYFFSKSHKPAQYVAVKRFSLTGLTWLLRIHNAYSHQPGAGLLSDLDFLLIPYRKDFPVCRPEIPGNRRQQKQQHRAEIVDGVISCSKM